MTKPEELARKINREVTSASIPKYKGSVSKYAYEPTPSHTVFIQTELETTLKPLLDAFKQSLDKYPDSDTLKDLQADIGMAKCPRKYPAVASDHEIETWREQLSQWRFKK